jgi:serine/threonine protein kinase
MVSHRSTELTLAIDFISKMLEKDPYRRMTMAEALEHPWLSGRELDDTGASSPGDLSNFSSINSNMSKDTIMGLSGGAATGLRTPALPSEHPDEDFSQPLRDLRLNTPHMRFQLPHNDSSFYAGPESDLDHSPDAKIHSAIHIPSQAIPPTVGALNSPNLKRKLTAVTVGAPIAEFSSGELSPAPSPPPSASPGPHTASASHSPITSYTPDAPSDSSAMGEPLAKAKRRIKRISDATKTPVRVSPRLNAKKQTNDESSPSTARARRTKR